MNTNYIVHILKKAATYTWHNLFRYLIPHIHSNKDELISL